jgi:hypothetical protein
MSTLSSNLTPAIQPHGLCNFFDESNEKLGTKQYMSESSYKTKIPQKFCVVWYPFPIILVKFNSIQSQSVVKRYVQCRLDESTMYCILRSRCKSSALILGRKSSSKRQLFMYEVVDLVVRYFRNLCKWGGRLHTYSSSSSSHGHYSFWCKCNQPSRQNDGPLTFCSCKM